MTFVDGKAWVDYPGWAKDRPWSEQSEHIKHRVWVEVTEAADRDWKQAQRQAIESLYGGDRWLNENETAVVKANLRRARDDYRLRVLSWFWQVVSPLKPGECVPNAVAELLAEEAYASAPPPHRADRPALHRTMTVSSLSK